MEASGALERIRPIIAVSAVVSVEATSLFRAAGADDFLAKPLSLGRLEGSLATHLGLRGRLGYVSGFELPKGVGDGQRFSR